MADPARASVSRLAPEIGLFVVVVVADAYGLVPISQTVVLLPLVWLLLRLRGERWSTIGFAHPDRLGGSIVVGVAAGVLMELLATYVTTPWISAFFGVEPGFSGFKAIRGNLPLLFLFLAVSWTLAAFGEEICFRGFLMKRLAQLFGESRGAWIAALALSSALFGWATRSRASPAGFRRA